MSLEFYNSMKELKNEALSNSLLIIESCTHSILVQLLDPDILWDLLENSVQLLGTPQGTVPIRKD